MKTVKDVMSALPVWVSESASFREIAARLRECRVSAFPVLDADGKVIGVVSEADLLVKEAVLDEPNVIWGLLAGIVHHAGRAKAGAVTAADLMTSPAVTIGPDDTVEHAARLMYDRKVKRLPVVDQAGRPVGIISRSDVLAVFDRTDAEIREEIMSQVIAGRSEPSWYSVIVKDGVVTLEGTPESRHRPRPGPAGPARPGRGSRARPPCLPGSSRPQQPRPLFLKSYRRLREKVITMRWSWRNIMIGTSAAAAAIGLAVSLVVVLAGRGVPPSAPKPSPGRSSQLYSPFTGEPVTALGPVLAVKIDNLAPARPQTGLAGADIVYVLPVEGGLSRFLAVFSSHFPPVIGPVRRRRGGAVPSRADV